MRVKYLSILIFIPMLMLGQKRSSIYRMTLDSGALINDTASISDLKRHDSIKIDNHPLIGFDDTELFVTFPGGDDEFLKYLENNIQYPDSAVKAKIEGKVYARFKIDTLGIISDIRIIQGLSTDIDNEVIRVISKIPDWVWDDRIKKNRRCLAERTLPIIFKLTKSKKH